MAATDEKISWKENPWWRIALLVVSAVAGFYVYLYGVPVLEKAIEHKIENPLRQLPATLLTLAVLWWFRTYDTRQQIEEAATQNKRMGTQIQNGKLVEGLRLLETDDVIQIDAGTQMLIQVSKATEEDGMFDTQIRLAFIKRVQLLPDGVPHSVPITMVNELRRKAQQYGDIPMLNIEKGVSIMDSRIPYTKHIFRWLCKHPGGEKRISLRDIDFFYHDFFDNNLKMNETIAKSNSNTPSYSVVIEISDIEHALGKFAEQDD